MPVLTEVFSAGQTKRYNIRGGFFRLLSASNNEPCNIKAYSSLSGNTEYIDAVLPGLAFTLNFDFIEISTATAQTISFAIFPGNVNYDRVVFETSTAEVIGDAWGAATNITLDSSYGILPNKYYLVSFGCQFYSTSYPTVPGADGNIKVYSSGSEKYDGDVDKTAATKPDGDPLIIERQISLNSGTSGTFSLVISVAGFLGKQNNYLSAMRYK